MSYTTTTAVTVPAPSRALTTLAVVKDDLGIVSFDEDDYLDRLILRKSRTVADWCRRVFGAETRADTFRRETEGVSLGWFAGASFIGHQGNHSSDHQAEPLILSNCPVIEISGFVMDGVDLVLGTDYEVDAPAGLLYRLGPSGLRRPWHFGVATVTYAGGFVLPVDSPAVGAPPRNLPDPVEEATIELIKQSRADRTKNASIKTDLVYDVRRVDYFEVSSAAGADLPGYLQVILEPYRMPVISK